MSKLLLIQAGKDAELENTLVETVDLNPSPPPREIERDLSTTDAAVSVTQGLSLQMKNSGDDEVVFDLHDAQGHSIELSLPLSSALFRQKRETEAALKGKPATGFFAALASEILSPTAPRRPMSLDALREAKAKRRAEKQPRWSRALELSKLQNEADRAMLILKAILQLAGRDPLANFSRLRLPSVLNRTVRGHQHSYPERTIELKQRAKHLALGSPEGMDLALSLLLNNAERYTPPDQPFEIDTFDAGSMCSIALLDNSGEEHLERYLGLWDMYDPTQAGPADMTSGSGISLSVGRQLVESMHGEVWCGHRKHGGSAFVISLPRARAGSRRSADLVRLPRKRALRH